MGIKEYTYHEEKNKMIKGEGHSKHVPVSQQVALGKKVSIVRHQ